MAAPQEVAPGLTEQPTAATGIPDEHEACKEAKPASTLRSDASARDSAAMHEATTSDQENVSPTKAARHSRVMSGTELSPLKILAEQRSSSPEAAAPRSPRKVSPEKRFPVKVSSGNGAPQEMPKPVVAAPEHMATVEEVVRKSEGLRQAVEIFEDEQPTVAEKGGDDGGDAGRDDATVTLNGDAPHVEADEEPSGPDDTMVSTLSTFSAVPNLTMLAKLGQSPAKFGGLAMTPLGSRDASSLRSGQAPTPGDAGNTTNLLDFTEQMRFPHKSPAKRSSGPVAATPNRPLASLIDFDIPPMPTPRSVPTITPRELESLKSGFLSEVSSLKASLSGKEAEVQSLKTAVGDAEKRVGECLEQLREARALKEQARVEKENWESRGREMETLLRKVRQEIVLGQGEREELERKLEESDRRREAAEMLHQEAESKMAGMRAGKDHGVDKAAASSSPSKAKSSAADVEAAVERVARELHALYKSKHETKVAALKKSYEGRWEKKVRELEGRIAELSDDNDKLRAGRDSTAAAGAGAGAAEAEELRAEAVRASASIKELTADVQRLEAVERTVRRDNDELRRMLELERVEKGELVQLAEEMMSMQSFVGGGSQRQQQQQQLPQSQPQPQRRQAEMAAPARTPRMPPPSSTDAGPRSAMARGGSGLRTPGSGLRAPHERTKSGGGVLPRPTGYAPRSGIMTSIERMGNYRGAGRVD